jgi:hypothetical protein
MDRILAYNKWAESKGLSSRQGITDFTDLDYSEVVKKYTGYIPGDVSGTSLKKASLVFTTKALEPSWG